MTFLQLKKMVARGEDSAHQFKEDVTNADSLGAEFVAFSNTSGGSILIGVSDKGKITGLSPQDVARINKLISNAASQHIRSPISPQTENVMIGNGRTVIVLTIPEGIDKPYFDRNGIIWQKNGSDKRRISSKEELRRIFQDGNSLYADEIPTNAQLVDIDKEKFRRFFENTYRSTVPSKDKEILTLLQNLELAKEGRITLAGLLLFGARPQRYKPVFMVKAASFPGTGIAVAEYLDSEDFEGTLDNQFAGALAFIMRNIRKVQGAQGVNTTGLPVIPKIVFEEVLVNALIHRDYFINAPVKILAFSDRIEITSPGTLPNHLTVATIKMGVSVVRNPLIVSFISKGILPYRGLGSGIRRTLEITDNIEFIDDREGCTFTVRVFTEKQFTRKRQSEYESVNYQNEPVNYRSEPINYQNGPGNYNREPESDQNEPINHENEPINHQCDPGNTETVTSKILTFLIKEPEISYDELALQIGKSRSTVKRWLQELRERGVIVRQGARKKGFWVVIGNGEK